MAQDHKGGFVALLRLAAAIGLLGWPAAPGRKASPNTRFPRAARTVSRLGRTAHCGSPNLMRTRSGGSRHPALLPNLSFPLRRANRSTSRPGRPDGALWFGAASLTGNTLLSSINRITTVGTITPHLVAGVPYDLSAGPDGALWFVLSKPDMIARITTSGTITQYFIPTSESTPAGIAAGPDGALWFTEFNGNKIGRITVPASTSSLVAAVLPSSRSVQVGHTPLPCLPRSSTAARPRRAAAQLCR
jgi:streptogramin lyase